MRHDARVLALAAASTVVLVLVLVLVPGCGALLGLGTAEETDRPSQNDGGADGATSSDSSIDSDASGSLDATIDGDGQAPSCASCASKHCQPDGGCDPLVFVTKTTYAGNFAAGTLEGVTRADGYCASAASGKFSGKFLAWMSGAAVNPESRFTKSTRPYWLRNDTKLAESYDALKTSGPLVPINIDETNAAVPNGERAWTGTTTGGLSKAQTCSDGFGDWRSTGATAKGMLGETNLTTYQWTDTAEGGCSSVTAHIYCFEQP